MIEARIVADSVNPAGQRITTFVCTYPRWILAELNTHRALSRNSASSRAIPVEKMIGGALERPAKPVTWGKNQKGMQADDAVAPENELAAVGVWGEAALDAVKHARRLADLGIHKQIANRLLEPFAHMTTIITATEWANFFKLRAHPDAQPEFQELAYKMLEAYVASTPRKLDWFQWHLPFADRHVEEVNELPFLLKIATARCARVSYLNFEGDIDHAKDYDLHDRLAGSGHWSPFEHPACAWPPWCCPDWRKSGLGQSPKGDSNFRGFAQYRKFLPNECHEEFDPVALLEQRRRGA